MGHTIIPLSGMLAVLVIGVVCIWIDGWWTNRKGQ